MNRSSQLRGPRPTAAWGLVLGLLLELGACGPGLSSARASDLFARSNLVAWCIVPFDSRKRGPEERAAMLERLGLRRLAYDWRAEHLPTFDAEVEAMRRRGIEITAWWFPAGLNDEARAILACLERQRIRPQLWVTMGTEPEPDPAKLAGKLDAAAATLAPVCAEAARLGCTVGLYNHLGWFGEPTNQVSILARLRAAGHTNAGLVYNFHHGHAHIGSFAEQLRAAGHTNAGLVYNFHHGHAHIGSFAEQLRVMQPHLLAINLNGMVRDGDRLGKKIIPLGTGDEELRMLQVLDASGWRGPVGILGHTDEDAEVKLRKELAGLDRLLPQVTAAVVAQAPQRAAGILPAPSAAPPGRAGRMPAARSPGEPPTSGMVPEEQQEADWTDNRWQRTEVGQWLASNLRLPDGSWVAKGLSIRVGDDLQAAVCYDLTHCALRASWKGGFLRFDPQRFGLIGAPRIGGDPLPSGLVFQNWVGLEGRAITSPVFRGLRVGKKRVWLEYHIAGAEIGDSPWLLNSPYGPVLQRDFKFKGGKIHTRLPNLASTNDGPVLHASGVGPEADAEIMVSTQGAAAQVTVWRQPPGEQSAGFMRDRHNWGLRLKVQASETWGTMFIWRGEETRAKAVIEFLTAIPRTELEMALKERPGSRWPAMITRGERGADTGPFAVDTLTMPYDNPFHALLFAAGVDFTPDGAAYVCTIHGDVWQVTGIDEELRALTWRRFATGLFQPLGLKVRDGQVFVLGRDRITRLHDLNGDGEADFYENFFDGIATSTGGHDYVTSLEKDDAGNFYYVDPRGVHRVAADGSRQETLATGFRNPNGLGARPDGGVITAAPQQGEWTPSSGLWEIRPDNVGLYGGYGGPKVTDARPAGFDAPLLWLPHAADNSSGSQVWVPRRAAGILPAETPRWDTSPLAGQMLHLLWGRCGMMLVLRDEGAGTAGGGARRTATGAGAGPTAPNGLAVPLPVKFLSGPNRGSFNPRDGHLYVAGSTGWQTSAVKDGALQRVRFTGRPAALPVAWRVLPDALALTFSEPLDPATAADAGSFSLKQWNYRYAARYGSQDWSVTDPTKEGRDDVPVAAAALSADGRTLTLRVPGLRPVMQFALRYNFDTAAGRPARGEVYGTVNTVP